MRDERKRRRVGKAAVLRTLSTLAVVGVVYIGLAIHTGTGTPSAWGIADVASLCPLGGIEVLLASKSFVPPLLIGLAFAVVLTLVLGRAFCAWGCPVPLLRRVFGTKKAGGMRLSRHARAEGGETGPRSPDVGEAQGNAADIVEVPRPRDQGGVRDSRNWVLGGTLLTTALFGFPVFCLVCPVGLTFATLAVVWRLFQFNEVTWSLVVFPAILAFELIVLRKWCHRFCPLGALLSLVARGNRTFRPAVQASSCLHMTGGETCRRCADACPEGIDLHDQEASAPLNECTKCRECSDACPVHAIRFPFLPKR